MHAPTLLPCGAKEDVKGCRGPSTPLRRTGLGGAALRLPRSAKDDNDFAWRLGRPPPPRLAPKKRARTWAPLRPRATQNLMRAHFLYVLKLDDLEGCFWEVGGDFSSPGRGLGKAWSGGGAALRLPRSAKDDNDFAWRWRPPP